MRNNLPVKKGLSLKLLNSTPQMTRRRMQMEPRSKTDVHLKDYSPQMKAICDKLAKANGKVHFCSVLFKVTNQTS